MIIKDNFYITDADFYLVVKEVLKLSLDFIKSIRELRGRQNDRKDNGLIKWDSVPEHSVILYRREEKYKTVFPYVRKEKLEEEIKNNIGRKFFQK